MSETYIGKDSLTNKMVPRKLMSACRKMKIDLYLTLYKKIQNGSKGDGEKVQLVKCLLHKLRVQSLTSHVEGQVTTPVPQC